MENFDNYFKSEIGHGTIFIALHHIFKEFVTVTPFP